MRSPHLYSEQDAHTPHTPRHPITPSPHHPVTPSPRHPTSPHPPFTNSIKVRYHNRA
ncbi:hypothetical protein CWATWH0003_5464 [Crocosphaera watsonii WH 0003]|uniref:Uncharacterized protein n=1 Tax=Crocosphaera watsonii WH 0003 TaxID=423471 RepID=G5JDH1_CROWT|nr:hypothetical protein CWATWH0003_5464 [Crocosphaera watsonii WH 0003]